MSLHKIRVPSKVLLKELSPVPIGSMPTLAAKDLPKDPSSHIILGTDRESLPKIDHGPKNSFGSIKLFAGPHLSSGFILLFLITLHYAF